MLLKHKRANELLITEFYSGETLCGQLMNKINYDLIVLDIEFPGLDGVKVGEFLRNNMKDSLTQILYVSGKDGYEQQFFDNRPLNFLRKPVEEKKLLSCLDQVLDAVERDMRIFSFSIRKTIHRLPLRDIMYFENLNKRVVIHARQTNYTVNERLDDIETMDGFIRIHRSFMLNGLYIRQMKFDSVTLSDGTQLPVSRTYSAEVRKFMLKQFSPTTE